MAICPQPGTSRRHRAHPVFPYLLRHRVITQWNDVWTMDIANEKPELHRPALPVQAWKQRD